MAKGIVLCQGDSTTCGGTIILGSAHGVNFGKPQAKERDPVTCGKDGSTYKIIGGISFYTTGADKKRIAGSLDSFSSCPCKAKNNSLQLFSYIHKGRIASFQKSDLAIAAPVPAALMPKLHSEPELHPQAAKRQKSFADTCKPEDNQLLNGVYIWTETKNAGHTFVSVHENNTVYLYTYGRYGRTNRGGFTGDGVLNFLQDEDARVYYRSKLYEMGASVFRIDDDDPVKTRAFFEDLWNSSKPAIQTSKMPETTRRRGHTITLLAATAPHIQLRG